MAADLKRRKGLVTGVGVSALQVEVDGAIGLDTAGADFITPRRTRHVETVDGPQHVIHAAPDDAQTRRAGTGEVAYAGGDLASFRITAPSSNAMGRGAS